MNWNQFKLILVVVLAFVAPSCAKNVADLEKKIAKGDYIQDIYNYPFEEVYDAVAFVWSHSEDMLIYRAFARCVFDYRRESKVILCRTKHGDTNVFYLSMGIFLEPQGESKTRVMFVQSHTFGGERGRTRIERIIDESHFYLRNGEEAYRKYTHEESLRTKKLYKSKGW
jgi:hypothetical protein